jgi:hypothetical protein
MKWSTVLEDRPTPQCTSICCSGAGLRGSEMQKIVSALPAPENRPRIHKRVTLFRQLPVQQKRGLARYVAAACLRRRFAMDVDRCVEVLAESGFVRPGCYVLDFLDIPHGLNQDELVAHLREHPRGNL